MTQKDFVVSADGHLLEPTDLFKTRLPKHLRDRAVWEEDFEIEPLVEGGPRVFRKLHTPGFEGWTVSRYRQTRGRMPEGDPEIILQDMDLDGVDAQVLYPNIGVFQVNEYIGMQADPALVLECVRAYNDFLVDFSSYAPGRYIPLMTVPFWDMDATMRELTRSHEAGHKGIVFPARMEDFALPALHDTHLFRRILDHRRHRQF